jgi:hypothetical protein
MRTISKIKRTIKKPLKIIRKLKRDVWIISGENYNKKNCFSIMFAGYGKSKKYITKLAFGNSSKEKYLGNIWLWRLQDKISCYNPDLLVLDIDNVLLRFYDRRKNFFVPHWISGDTDISVDISSIMKSKSSLLSIKSKINKNNYCFEMTKDKKQFEYFYYNMYLPFITKRHGDRAIIKEYDNLKQKFINCELLLIKKNEEYVAGGMIDYGFKKAIPRLSKVGIKSGNLQYLKDRVLGARIYFSISYLKDKGYKRLDLGGSKAFLDDGSLRSKKEWQIVLNETTKDGYLIRPLTSAFNTKEFLSNNPFIFLDRGKLTGAIFLDREKLNSNNDIMKVYNHYYYMGMEKLVAYVYSDQINRIKKMIPAEISNEFEICSATEIFEN